MRTRERDFDIETILNKYKFIQKVGKLIRFTSNLSACASCNKEQQADDFSRWDVVLGQQTRNVTPRTELAMQMPRSHFTDGYPM